MTSLLHIQLVLSFDSVDCFVILVRVLSKIFKTVGNQAFHVDVHLSTQQYELLIFETGLFWVPPHFEELLQFVGFHISPLRSPLMCLMPFIQVRLIRFFVLGFGFTNLLLFKTTLNVVVV